MDTQDADSVGATGHPVRRTSSIPGIGVSRRPALRWERADIDRYVVYTDDCVLGFVEVVGNVFVVLVGSRYDRAEEIAQLLDFDAAILMLSRRG